MINCDIWGFIGVSVDNSPEKNTLLIMRNMLSCIRYFSAFVKGVCHGK